MNVKLCFSDTKTEQATVKLIDFLISKIEYIRDPYCDLLLRVKLDCVNRNFESMVVFDNSRVKA